MQSLFRLIFKMAHWPTFALLLIAIVLCNIGFAWRAEKMGSKNELPDAQFWYSQTEAKEFLKKIKPEGRNLYALTELTLDILYPLIYTTTLGVLIIWLYSERVARRLLMLPLMGGGFDLLENFQLAYLALSYDGTESAVALTAALCTATKFVFLGASVLVVIVGAIGGLWSRRTKVAE